MTLDTTSKLATATAAPMIVRTAKDGTPVYACTADGMVILYELPEVTAAREAAWAKEQEAARAADAAVAARRLAEATPVLDACKDLCAALDTAAALLDEGASPGAVATLAAAIVRNPGGDPAAWVSHARTICKVRGAMDDLAVATLAATIGAER